MYHAIMMMVGRTQSRTVLGEDIQVSLCYCILLVYLYMQSQEYAMVMRVICVM